MAVFDVGRDAGGGSTGGLHADVKFASLLS